MNGGTFQGPAGICKICNVELQDRLIASQHYNGKQHLTNVARMSKRQENVRNGVFVRRSDISTIPDSEFIALFSQFGFVQEIRRPPTAKNYCVVKFEDSCAAQRALNARRLFLKGKYLPISPERVTGTRHNMKRSTKPNLKQSQPFVDRKKVAALPEPDLVNLNDLPDNIVSFDDAVNDFVKRIEADPSLEQKHQMVCADLEWTFSKELPGVKARLFGSTITGLAFKESDLDIFMECPNGQPPREFIPVNRREVFRDSTFVQIRQVANARVPIIRCQHRETKFQCDISFTSRLSLEKTLLVKFLFSLDERVRPAFMAIKYWAKNHEIVGDRRTFNCFTLQLLFMFYLQQLDEPILPAVKFLQDLVEEKSYCDGWICSFCNNKRKIPPVNNKSSIKELLLGFFEYYSKFDYNNQVVCPFIGRPVRKEFFRNIQSTDESFLSSESNRCLLDAFKIYSDKVDDKVKHSKLRVNEILCVQDPIVLTVNVACFGNRALENFIYYCKSALETLSKDMNVKESFQSFFIKKIKEPTKRERKMVKRNMIPDSNASKKRREEFLMVIKINEFGSLNFTNKIKTEGEMIGEDYKTEWFKCIKNFIMTIFDAVCHLEYFNDSNEIESFLNEPFKSIQLNCTGYYKLFTYRSKLTLQSEYVDYFNKQADVTAYINDNIADPRKFYVSIEISCDASNEMPSICLDFKESKPVKVSDSSVLVSSNSFCQWITSNIINICKSMVDLYDLVK